MTLPERIRAARRAQGHSLNDAGRALNVHRQTWHKWEAGTQAPHGLRMPEILAYIHAGNLKTELATTGENR